MASTSEAEVSATDGESVTSRDRQGRTVHNRQWRGHIVSDFRGVSARLDRLQEDFSPRSSDVLVLAYPKCGTHWVNEICHFLLTRQTETRPQRKETRMLEAQSIETLEAVESPRLLNSHLRLDLLPSRILRECRVVYVVRNPKDAAVSLFHHYVSIDDYEYQDGEFDGFVGLFLDGHLDGGLYGSHVASCLRLLRQERRNECPRLLLVEYEKLKANTRAEVERIDRFLNPQSPNSPDILSDVCRRVEFGVMRAERGADTGGIFNSRAEGSGFYRGGRVGDWRGVFSEEDSRLVDRMVESQLKEFKDIYWPDYG